MPDEFKETQSESLFNHLFGNYWKTISKTTACTLGRNNVDTCQGDSGGPLMVRQGGEGFMYLKGLVSFGTSKCGSGNG